MPFRAPVGHSSQELARTFKRSHGDRPAEHFPESAEPTQTAVRARTNPTAQRSAGTGTNAPRVPARERRHENARRAAKRCRDETKTRSAPFIAPRGAGCPRAGASSRTRLSATGSRTVKGLPEGSAYSGPARREHMPPPLTVWAPVPQWTDRAKATEGAFRSLHSKRKAGTRTAPGKNTHTRERCFPEDGSGTCAGGRGSRAVLGNGFLLEVEP